MSPEQNSWSDISSSAGTGIQNVASDEDREVRVSVKGTENQADWVILAPGGRKGKNDGLIS